jgi:hypothetical protein
MHICRYWLLVVCAIGLVAAVNAQDRGKANALAKQYAQSLQLGPAEAAQPKVDARLVAWFVGHVAQCFRSESGAALDPEDGALVREYAPALLMQFRSAFGATSCDPSKPVTDACLAELSKIDCEPFARAVHAAGWDRAPSPAMEAAVDKYSQRLATHYLACQSGGSPENEESTIRAEYMTHSTSLQIAMLLTTGQCTLDLNHFRPCLESIDGADACKSLSALAQRSHLSRFCAEFLDCSAEPSLVGKIAK